MDSEKTTLSDFAVPEYLPQNKLLVDLYYDHIMPIPPAPNYVNSAANENQKSSAKSVNPTPIVANLTDRSPIPSTKKPPTARLEDLVIINDPRRTTPGYATPEANRAERVLSVRPPKGIVSSSSNNNKAINNTISDTLSCMKRGPSETNHHSPSSGSDAEPVVKKRVKLKRDFTNLP